MTRQRPHVALTLTHLSWHHILRAIIEVITANRDNAPVSGWEHNEIAWVIHSELRKDLHERTRAAWCRQTKIDLAHFPYSEDCVARLYFQFRSLSEKGLEAVLDDCKAGDR